jgi:DNA-binding NarL/FixJ family response regulator
MTEPSNEPVCIIIADDHPLFRGALKGALEGIDRPVDITEAKDFDSLKLALGEKPEADLVLLDLNMPGVSGFSGLIHLRAEYPAIPVMMVTGTDDAATVRRALSFGATGFLAKSASLTSIRTGVEAVLEGEVWVPDDIDLQAEDDPEIEELMSDLASLTPQQSRVLAMISDGLLNKQIAYELSVSEATVKAHVSAVLQKLRVDSRTQAVIKLSKIGFDAVQAN